MWASQTGVVAVAYLVAAMRCSAHMFVGLLRSESRATPEATHVTPTVAPEHQGGSYSDDPEVMTRVREEYLLLALFPSRRYW